MVRFINYNSFKFTMVEKLTIEEIRNVKSRKHIYPEKNIYLVEFDGYFKIVKRVGKCNYKKCKNACCKFLTFTYPHEYYEGFGKISENQKKIIINKKCKFLDSCGKCTKWGEKSSEVDYSNGFQGRTKGFPRACEQFPHIDDCLYNEVADKCSFEWEVIHKIKKFFTDDVREEMIMSFKALFGEDEKT